MGAKTFENPLLSHARMRGLYRGMVEVRGLKLVPRGLEACWVAAAIELGEGDLVFSMRGEKATDYVRALGLRKGKGSAKPRDVQRARASEDGAFAGTASEGLLVAAGAAGALKAAGGDRVALALSEGKGPIEASWVRVMRITDAGELPLITLALPDLGKVDWSAVGRRAGLPVIPVDASDAVGLYRVMQESLVRARADRRGVVIECVASGADPVKVLGGQLVAKQIATAAWLDGVRSEFKELLAGNR